MKYRSIANLPDEGVDLDSVDVVQLLQSLLDLGLVGLRVDDEDQGVVLLDLLHGALGVERVNDDLAGIEARLVFDRFAGVLRGARELQGLGKVEGGALSHFGDLVRVDLSVGTGRQNDGSLTRLKVKSGSLRRAEWPLLLHLPVQRASWLRVKIVSGNCQG